jgi:hypothetical protein
MIKVLEKYKKRIDVPLLAITFFIILLGPDDFIRE